MDEQDSKRRGQHGSGSRRAGGSGRPPGLRIIGAESASAAAGNSDPTGGGDGLDQTGAPRESDRGGRSPGAEPAGRSRFALPEDATSETFRRSELGGEGGRSRRDMRVAASRFLGMDDELEELEGSRGLEELEGSRGLEELEGSRGLEELEGTERVPRGDHSGDGAVPEMLHWSEPATGEVPKILVDEPDGPEPEDDLSAWASTGRGLSFRGDHLADWDDEYEPAVLGDDETRVGALVEQTEEPDLYSFDVLDPPTGEWHEGQDPREATFDPPFVPGDGRRSAKGARRSPGSRGAGGSGGRSLPIALTTGIGAGIVALVLFKIGPVAALLLSIVVVTMAAAELFAVLRRSGYQPATLLGLVATVALMIATYIKGETAIPLILALTVVFSMLWYLAGVVRARPLANVASTVLAVSWVGVLGSYAGLLLDPHAFPNRHGIAFLSGAILATVGYDVGGLVVGRVGRRQLAPVTSPGKTWEGLIGGMVASLLVSIVIVAQIHPWTIKRAIALGVVVAVVAPLGDLCESMIKRDIGIKDMGSILPGHGGVLDRVDALLFVLPATYYLVRLLNIG